MTQAPDAQEREQLHLKVRGVALWLKTLQYKAPYIVDSAFHTLLDAADELSHLAAVAQAASEPMQEPKPMPNPTAMDLVDPLFDAIWNATKTWDVNAPEYYVGYCGLNGSHVMLILEAVRAAVGLDAARYRWLRGRCDDCAVELSFSPSVEKGWITVQQNNDQGPALDSAIDAAMAERPAEGGSK